MVAALIVEPRSGVVSATLIVSAGGSRAGEAQPAARIPISRGRVAERRGTFLLVDFRSGGMSISASKEIAIWAAVIGLLVGLIVFRESRWGQRFLSGGPRPVEGPIPQPVAGVLPASPDRKIAFIGDTGAGAEFRK